MANRSGSSRCGKCPERSNISTLVSGNSRRAVSTCDAGIIRSRLPQISMDGREAKPDRRFCALTVWPWTSMTLRLVARNARLASASASVGRVRHASSELGLIAGRPSFDQTFRAVSPTPCTHREATSGSTNSLPGRVAARSNGFSSRPRPPLLTSTRALTRSGNRYAICNAMPPPSEWPTTVASAIPRASNMSRRLAAWALSE